MIHKFVSGEIMKTSLCTKQNAHAWVMWNIFSSLFNPTGREGEGRGGGGEAVCEFKPVGGNEGGWQTATCCTIPESGCCHLKVQLKEEDREV